MMVRSHFAGDVTEQGDIKKTVSKGWCKERMSLYRTWYAMSRYLVKQSWKPVGAWRYSDQIGIV